MSFATAALREEAARFRRMKFLIADGQTLRAIDDYARELEQKADVIEARETGEVCVPAGPVVTSAEA